MRIPAIILLMIASFSVLFAGEVRTYDVESAIAAALTGNQTILQLEKDLVIASNQQEQAFADYVLPTASVSGTFNLIDPDTVNKGVTAFSTNAWMDNYALGVTLSRTLFAGFRYQNAWEAKKAAVDLAKRKLLDKRADIIANVRTSFYSLLLLRENRKIAEDLDRSLSNRADSAKVKYDAGYVSEYDYIRTGVQYQNNRPNVLRAKNAYDQSKLAFLQLLGADIHQEAEFRGALYDSTNLTVSVDDASSLYALALSNDIGIASIDAAVRAYEYALKIAEGSRYPSLLANVGGNLNYKKDKVTDPGRSWVPSWTASLVLSVPIDVWVPISKTALSLDESALNIEKLKLSRLQAIDAIKLQVDTLIMQISVAREIVKSQEENVKQATLGYKMAQDKYNSGASSSLDLTDAEVSYNQALANRLQAIYDYFSGNIRLIRLIGEQGGKK